MKAVGQAQQPRSVSWRLYGIHLPRGNVCPVRYFSMNYPNFSPRFTLSWRSPPSRLLTAIGYHICLLPALWPAVI